MRNLSGKLGAGIMLVLVLAGCRAVGVQNAAPSATTAEPERIASPFPTLTPAAADNPQPPPAGEDARLLMLYSHARWQSLWVDMLVTNYQGDAAQTVNDQTRYQFWLQQPAAARLVSGPADGAPQRLWVSDGLAQQENGGGIETSSPATIGDFAPPFAVDSITPHPYAGRMGAPAADFIFATGLGQRSGEYRLVGRENWAGREALVVEYYRYPDDPVLERLWVDAETGVILRYISFGKPGGGPPSVEVQVQQIQVNPPIDPALFEFGQPTPAAFAAAP